MCCRVELARQNEGGLARKSKVRSNTRSIERDVTRSCFFNVCATATKAYDFCRK
jgi:hypothetical protein